MTQKNQNQSEGQHTHVALPVNLFKALTSTMLNGSYPNKTFSQTQQLFTDVERYALGVTIKDKEEEPKEKEEKPKKKEG
ncbi:MAG: hypothetical protein ACLFUH_06600 [Bacteroidales bacterium]